MISPPTQQFGEEALVQTIVSLTFFSNSEKHFLLEVLFCYMGV
jgi:hypothetical protein